MLGTHRKGIADLLEGIQFKTQGNTLRSDATVSGESGMIAASCNARFAYRCTAIRCTAMCE